MNKFFVLGTTLLTQYAPAQMPFLATVTNRTIHQDTGDCYMMMTELDSMIKETLEHFHIPGLQIGLIMDGEVILSRGYGYRNLAEAKLMAEDTVIGIGSVSKTFATYLLHQLIEEGKLSWNDPVMKHVPEFRLSDPHLTQKLTILDLASHRTGIFRHDALWYFSDRSKLSPLEGLKLLPFLEPENKLGEKFQYNNFMYSILGLIIERVTELTYEEVVLSTILKPLGMTRSGFSHGLFNYSLPYANIEEEIREIAFQETPAIAVGGGIYSTVSDMLKWVELHLQKGASMKELYTVHMPFAPSPGDHIRNEGYGLGWFVGEYRGCEHLYHGGVADGFAAHIALLPQKKIGLVILTNSSSDGLETINFMQRAIFDRILGLDNTHSLPEKKTAPNEEKKAIIASARPLQDYMGDYSHPAYGLIQVKLFDNQIILFYSHKSIPLTPSGDNRFTADLFELQKFGVSPQIEISFSMNSERMISEIQVPFEAFRSGKPIIFSRTNSH